MKIAASRVKAVLVELRLTHKKLATESHARKLHDVATAHEQAVAALTEAIARVEAVDRQARKEHAARQRAYARVNRLCPRCRGARVVVRAGREIRCSRCRGSGRASKRAIAVARHADATDPSVDPPT